MKYRIATLLYLSLTHRIFSIEMNLEIVGNFIIVLYYISKLMFVFKVLMKLVLEIL